MSELTIDAIYATNEKIRQRLKKTAGSLTDEQANSLPEGEKWTAAQIVEHISIVDEGIGKICNKLLQKAEAEGKLFDGSVRLSPAFLERSGDIANMRLEAPERVRPTGGKTIAESLAVLDENRIKLNSIKQLFETFDGNEFTFPHPFFGEISAIEWLRLLGGHEARHTRQIEALVAKIGE
jgi:hypothetical protein